MVKVVQLATIFMESTFESLSLYNFPYFVAVSIS